MNFVILDLEWNSAYSHRRKGYINEIIEFGAVKTDDELNIIDNFRMMVKPQVGKKLNGTVRQLTNISHEELAAGSPFLLTAESFSEWLGHDEATVLMTWGTGDLLTLLDNYKYFSKYSTIPFLTHYVNLQTYIQSSLNLPSSQQLGLLSAANLLEVPVEMKSHHRALDDSIITCDCLRARWNKSELLSRIQTADDEFYRRLTFKTRILVDLNNPLIDRSKMVFDCGVCGRRAEQQAEWELHNRVFLAPFLCKSCLRSFYGKIQFRLKYDGLAIWKRTAEIVSKEDAAESS